MNRVDYTDVFAKADEIPRVQGIAESVVVFLELYVWNTKSVLIVLIKKFYKVKQSDAK